MLQHHPHRAELDALQLATIAAQIPAGNRLTFSARAAVRLRENFIGKPLPQKIGFIAYALHWALGKIRARLTPAPRAPAIVGDRRALRVAARVYGSIGDYVNASPVLEALDRAGGAVAAPIDFFGDKPHGAAFVFHGAPFIGTILASRYLGAMLPRYDVVLHLQHMAFYDVMSEARLCTLTPGLANTIAEANERWSRDRVYYDQHPLLDGVFSRLMAAQGRNRLDTLGHYSGLPVDRRTPIALRLDPASAGVVARHGLRSKGYITVHDGFDASYRAMSKRATKQWPLEHWAELARLLKSRHPALPIVQLGADHSGHIAGVDLDLVDRTTLAEAGHVLKGALLHIDGESGLARVATALGTRALVMFGPTNAEFFAFPQNINVVSRACGNCWWTRQDWQSFCPRGLAEPECMASISPAEILEAASAFIAEAVPEAIAV